MTSIQQDARSSFSVLFVRHSHACIVISAAFVLHPSPVLVVLSSLLNIIFADVRHLGSPPTTLSTYQRSYHSVDIVRDQAHVAKQAGDDLQEEPFLSMCNGILISRQFLP